MAWLAADTPDTDLVVRLCDVHPDGRSFHVCDGILRLRFRDGWDEAWLMEPEFRVMMPLMTWPGPASVVIST